MVKVGKILGIREIFLIFFDFWGFFLSTRSSSEHSEHSECGGGDFGSTRSNSEHSEHSDFLGWGFWKHSEQLGAARSVGEMVGTGAWWGLALASFSECSECSECSDDKKVWGVGVGIFCWWFGFFL